MYEEQFLNLLETVNIKFGNLDTRLIKAWFDTDCEDLLKWICTSITEDCYISDRQDTEYSQIDLLKINNKINQLETEYEDILDTETNLFKIELAKDTIEMLEEELAKCDYEIRMNQQLYRSLSEELSNVKLQELYTQIEEESKQDNCLKLSNELDDVNQKSFDQIVKYGCYLQNYEYSIFPEFINNKNITEIENQFSTIVVNLNSAMKLEAASINNIGDTLSELENRIYNSKIDYLSLQMEVEALDSVLSFFNNVDIIAFYSSRNNDLILSSLNIMKSEQCDMVKTLEEISSKLAKQYITKHTLVYLKKEHDFMCNKLNYINTFKENLMNILIHFILMQNVYLQEKQDINVSGQFFRNISKYSSIDLKKVNIRRELMLTVISDCEKYTTELSENNFKLLEDFGKILKIKNKIFKKEVLAGTWLLRDAAHELTKSHKNHIVFNPDLEKLRRNNDVLRDFLHCGATVQMVIIPTSLQTALFQINQNLTCQKAAVSALLQVAQKSKEIHKKDKWLSNRNLLWVYFMTNGSKMLEFLDRLRNERNYELEKYKCSS